ncbi:dihydrolipoamide acetyltransferase family protein [Microbacterium sp.]|uniref:dihydrolipoamide acetyltransferase family protein n=1 Tax=Microbacterium sp. TaxID=51671 RepID=UPI0028A6CA0C|nr:dihydrolipoamide acetyltransferase family protein [Microbacterium sp.]
MTTETFTLPDVGEGLTEAELVAWKVAPGDAVAINDVICEIETAKSLVELPSPHAGVVGELLVAEGVTVEVGSPIITFVSEAEAADAGIAANPKDPAAPPATDEGGGSVLVGYGTGGGATSRRRALRQAQGPSGQAQGPSGRAQGPNGQGPVRSSVGVIAKPPIRKLARDLNVDLADVTPSGADGEVTRDDVVKHAEQASVFRNIETPARSAVREEKLPVTPQIDEGRSESIPVKGVRKATSSAMVRSAYSAPHVTVWKEIDATRTMELVKRLKASPDYADIRISPLLIMARAVIWAARRTPTVNAAWVDTDSGAEIVVRHYVNLGIAAATPRGLLVPNIKDAQELSMKDLARALNRLTLTAREGKTSPADQQGGTITITNIGVFGMDAGTPIINPGEAGIVAMGTIAQKPWVVDGEVRPRWVTTVSGSFDHRVIDGDGMSRFIADVASILEEPALLVD